MTTSNDASPPPCPRCGAVLSADAPGGLCPRCLMEAPLETETMLTGDHQRGRATGPTLEDLAPLFPHLDLLECLGRGGMGVVYKARQKSLDRLVAVKLLAPERVSDQAFAARFEKEAQALARLSHPNIVTVHDFGAVGDGDARRFYLIMEFVDGVNLRQAMEAGHFTPEQALAIVPPVCEALQYAHERGIVHRDIKPENLLLDKEGQIKIADFGIARMVGDSVESAEAGVGTAAATLVGGTPRYMAPEQASDPARVDHRADIYSLGVVLYELLTGEAPEGAFEAPSKRVQVDVRLDEIVLRALEQTPELRYQTAGEFRTQLATLAVPHGEADPAPIEAAAREWLAVSDRGQHEEAWRRAHPWFQKEVGEAAWAKKVRAVRDPLGQVMERVQRSVSFAPGEEGGCVVEFQTCFRIAGLFREQLFMEEITGGGWKVTGYLITPPEEPAAKMDEVFGSGESAGERSLIVARLITLAFVGMTWIGLLSVLRVGVIEALLVLAALAFIGHKAGVFERWSAQTWSRILGWTAAVLAVPTIGFGGWGMISLLGETGGWHPAPSEAVVIMLHWVGMVALPWAAWVLLRPPAAAEVSRSGGGLRIMLWGVSVCLVVLAVTVITWTASSQEAPSVQVQTATVQRLSGLPWLFVGTGFLLMGLCAPMILRKVPMNALYGARIPESLSSESEWYDINAYAGRQLAKGSGFIVASGIVGLFLPTHQMDRYTWWMLFIVLAAVLVPTFQMLRFAKHPGKRSTPKSKGHKALMSILLWLPIAIFVKTFVVETFRVTGTTAAPELPPNSLVLASKLRMSYQAGDIIIYTDPKFGHCTGRVQGVNAEGLAVQHRLGEAALDLPWKRITGKVITVLWRASMEAGAIEESVGAVSVVRDDRLGSLQQDVVVVSDQGCPVFAELVFVGAEGEVVRFPEAGFFKLERGRESRGAKVQYELLPSDAGSDSSIAQVKVSNALDRDSRSELVDLSPGLGAGGTDRTALAGVRWMKSTPRFMHYFGGGEWELETWNDFPLFEAWRDETTRVGELRLRLLAKRPAKEVPPNLAQGFQMGRWTASPVAQWFGAPDLLKEAAVREWTDVDRLRGKWKLSGLGFEGKWFEGGDLMAHLAKEHTFSRMESILGGTLRFPHATNDWAMHQTMRLDEEMVPRQMDLTFGTATTRGIYRFLPEGMELALSMPGSNRPSELTTRTDGASIVLRYELE